MSNQTSGTTRDPAQGMRVNLTYYKSTGKYYEEGSYETAVPPCKEGYPPLYAIWDEVQAMRDQGRLPGLCRDHSRFIVSVDVPGHPHEHPRLLV